MPKYEVQIILAMEIEAPNTTAVRAKVQDMRIHDILKKNPRLSSMGIRYQRKVGIPKLIRKDRKPKTH